jgi:hypothetical protein
VVWSRLFPGRERVCPRGLEVVNDANIEWINRDGESVPKPQSWPRRPGPWLEALWRGDPQPLRRRPIQEVRKFYAEGVHAVCPNKHRLPEEIMTKDSVVIALVGQQASGKSLYVACLIRALVHDAALMANGFVFSLQGDSGARFAAEYDGFFEHGQVPFETQRNTDDQASREPWHLLMHRPDGSTVNVLIFDADGRQLGTINEAATFNPHLFATHAFLFFAPANVVPHVRITEARDDHRMQGQTSTQQVITNVVEALRRTDPTGGDFVGSLIISKADDIDPDELDDYLGHVVHDGPQRRVSDLATLDADIGESSRHIHEFILAKGGAGLIANFDTYYPETSYHLVSTARGKPVDGYFTSLPEPTRVLDPFVRVMVSLGAMTPGEEFEESSW